MQVIFSWNLVADFQQMWSFPFMVNAFRAGAVVALVAGAIGWFMVLRRQSFAGHTLGVVAFPGASFATLVGISTGLGYFGFCLAAALVIALLRREGRDAGAEESAATGVVQTFLLACGFLFIALYKGLLSGPEAILFGSFLGITSGQVLLLALVGAAVLAVLAWIGRPLLFASVDPQVAAARGVPVRALSIVFLLLLGAATAEAAQITGSLLVFALLVLPAATAQVLTARPGLSLLLTLLLGFAATWAGLVAAWYWPYPLGFFVTSFAFGGYLLAHALTQVRARLAVRTGSGGGTGGRGDTATGTVTAPGTVTANGTVTATSARRAVA